MAAFQGFTLEGVFELLHWNKASYFVQVSCGQAFTLAITEDGKKVFGWGDAEHCAFGSRQITGDHYYPIVSLL